MYNSDKLNEIIKNLKNGNSIVIFKSNSKYDVDIDFFENLIKENKGRYRLPKNGNVLADKVAKAKLVLFQNNESQKIIGCGILRKMSDTDSLLEYDEGKHDLCGPFKITDAIRKDWSNYYEKNKKTGNYQEKPDQVDKEKDYDKKFYQFEVAELLNEPIDADELISYSTDQKINKPLLADAKKGFIASVYNYKIRDVKVFKNLLKRKSVNSIMLNCFKDKKKYYPYSLISEINYCNLELIHTNFLSNFIMKDNIYNLKKKPLDNLLKLIIKKNNNQLASAEILKDNYVVLNQSSYTDDDSNGTPDIILLGNKYRIIIEAKYYGEENSDNQMDKYYKYYETKEKEKRKNIYVFLSLKSNPKLTIDKYDKKVSLSKITFYDILNKVYVLNNHMDNKEIFIDYLKSLVYAVLNKEISISDIPFIPWLYKINDCKKILNNYQIKKVIDNEVKLKFNKKMDFVVCKYMLVMLYNNYDKSIKIKPKDLEKLYNSLKYVE